MARSVAERFWEKVRTGAECWLWTAGRSNGYGMFHPTKRTAERAHRVAWLLVRGGHPCVSGPIPTGLDVCHTCDVKLCVRPEHLFLGTVGDNNRDMYAKGRGNTQLRPELMGQMRQALRASGRQIHGEQCHASKLSADDVRVIRRRFLAGASKAALAREFQVSEASIFAIVTGRTWRHVT